MVVINEVVLELARGAGDGGGVGIASGALSGAEGEGAWLNKTPKPRLPRLVALFTLVVLCSALWRGFM